MTGSESIEHDEATKPDNGAEAVELTDEQIAAGEAAAAQDDPAAALAAQVDGLSREVAALKEENLRLIAEGRNQAARFRREKADALKYADADFAREMLVILDDLQRTRESAAGASDAKAVVDGVRIVYDQFLKILRDRNIEPIEAVGKPFDPNFHEALLKQPSPDVAAGVVMQEVARGFRMHERVLRPTKVIVSSGPPAEPRP